MSSSDESGDSTDGDLYTDEERVVTLAKELMDHPYASHSDLSDESESLNRAAVFFWKLNNLSSDVVQILPTCCATWASVTGRFLTYKGT